MTEADIKIMRFQIQYLFTKSINSDPADQLRYVSNYYAYLADCIDYHKIYVDADKELVDSFESVYLWLNDKLLLFSESVRDQVVDIMKTKKLCDTFAIISNLSEPHLREMRNRTMLNRSFPNIFIRLLKTYILPVHEEEYITSRNLFDTKMALRRLSQLVKFASTVETVDYDESFTDFKTNYDPNLVDKNKLLTLLSYLKVQSNDMPDNDHKDKLLKKLDSIEAEIRKSKVSWGVVITGFFILFGFLADLKTLNPGVYDNSLKTVETILSLIHRDGIVQKSHFKLLAIDDDNSEDDHKTDVLPDFVTLPPRRDDKLQDGNTELF